MPIPLSQLETWSNRSQTQTAINAHTQLRAHLRATDSPIRIINYSDYLQGSYVNDTNIWRDHDVDILIQLDAAFDYTFDLNMSPDAQLACQAAMSSALFHLEHFRPEVIRRLVAVYGQENIEEGNKAVRVKGVPGVRLDADVVICQQFRCYYAYNGDLGAGFHQGISFRDRRYPTRIVVNFPKQHLDNGQNKNQNTSEGFKRTVRIYKNARNYLIDNGKLPEGTAPSYFLQGLLYNVPSEYFSGDIARDFYNSLAWLSESAPLFEQFLCQNGLLLLFGDTPEQWNLQESTQFLHQLMRLYTDWS